MTNDRSSSSDWITLLRDSWQDVSESQRFYLQEPWAFALGDDEGRFPAILGPEVMARGAGRPVISFSPHQRRYLADFVDVRKTRMIAKTGRGGSKTMCSSLGEAVLAWCLPVFTCTVNAGSLEQAQENYRYWTTFCSAAAMRDPIGPVVGEPKVKSTKLRRGGWLRILAASERQAKGPHPMMVVLDEACATDPDIMLLVEGQLTGGGVPFGGKAPLYRIQSTPDKLFHHFRDRWENRVELGYIAHEWGAKDCPWITQAEIDQALIEHDSNWARIFLDGEFGSAAGTVFEYADIQVASVSTLQEDPRWVAADEDPSLIARTAMGVDWGYEHHTVIIVLAQVQEVAFVVHVEGHQHKPEDFLYERIGRAASTWSCPAFLDTSHIFQNERVKRLLSPMGLRATPVASSKYNMAMIGEVNRRLERGLLRIPLAGEGATLLRQLADYSWDEKAHTEKPLKVNDDYVDALKFAAWGLRRGKAGMAAMRLRPPGPRLG